MGAPVEDKGVVMQKLFVVLLVMVLAVLVEVNIGYIQFNTAVHL